MARDRIKEKFAAIRVEGRIGLIAFLTAGFPDSLATLALVPALVAAGADAIELGVPFSDPLAEGPTIQKSSYDALQQHVSLRDCLLMVKELRDQVPDTPLILMGYYNPIYQFGLSQFAMDAKEAGVDGIIVVDLPQNEVGPLATECIPRGIHVIPLLAPTSTDASIQTACTNATGFIYCISVTGVTGAREQVSQQGFDLLNRVRANTSLPLAIGFGISKQDQIKAVGKMADAAVVGSALIRVMLDSPRDQLVSRASQFIAQLTGTTSPINGEAAV
jgi:tryptophan synthase alpha chain